MLTFLNLDNMPTGDAILAGSMAATGSLMDAFMTGNMNKKSREFSREMYNVQKADNLEFWNMQNAYNSPAEQMARFKAAGLNPNLIYGQQNTAGPISSPDVQKPQFDTPNVGAAVPSALSAIDLVTNLELKQAQIDNVRAQNDVIKQQAVYLGSQISGTEASTKRKLLDYNLEERLFDTNIDARKEALRQMRNNIDISTRRDIREAVQQSSNLKEAEQRILSAIQDRAAKRQQMAQSRSEVLRIQEDTKRITQQIENMRKEGKIKDLDVWLSSQAIRPGDNTWYRVVASLFDTLINTFK